MIFFLLMNVKMSTIVYTKLHTKFQGHRSIGSGEEDFAGFYNYMYNGGQDYPSLTDLGKNVIYF